MNEPILQADPYADIYKAVQLLTSWCDWAKAEDNVGWNALDTAFGHSLAKFPYEKWSRKQLRAAYKLIQKYKGQLLLRAGLDISKIPEPPALPETQETRLIFLHEGDFYVTYPKDPAAKEDVYKMGGKWDKVRKGYKIPKTVTQELSAFAEFYGFYFGDGVKEALSAQIRDSNRTLDASRASETDFDVPGLKLPLRPFQRAGVEFLLNKKKAILADEMGLGKTFEALSAVFCASGYPAIIICPKSMKSTWSEEILRLLPKVSRENILVCSGKPKRNMIEDVLRLISFDDQIRQKGRENGIDINSSTNGPSILSLFTGESGVFEKPNSLNPTETKQPINQVGRGRIDNDNGISPAKANGAFSVNNTSQVSTNRNIGGDMNTRRVQPFVRQTIPGSGINKLPQTITVNAQILSHYGEDFAILCANYCSLYLRLGEFSKLTHKNLQFLIVNFDICSAWMPIFRNITYNSIIVDECHRVKNSQAKSTKSIRELARNKEYVYLLSGSPMLNRPFEFVSYLQIMEVLDSEWGGWSNFVKTYCNARQRSITVRNKNGEKVTRIIWEYGWENEEEGKSHMAERLLNKKARETRYIRRVKRDKYDKDGNLLEKGVSQDELPPKQITEIKVEIDNRTEYDKAEDDLIKWIYEKAKRDQEFLKSLVGVSPHLREQLIEERAKEKAEAAERAEHLARINELRQLADKGKRYAVTELAQSLDEANEPYLMFGWFKENVMEMAGSVNAPYITGTTNDTTREQNRKKFQSGEIKKLALNIRAGGVGLTLIGPKEAPCGNMIFGGLDWSPKMLEQAEGRNDRINTGATMLNVWYILGENTIDEELYALLDRKRKSVNISTDGDDEEVDIDVLNGMVDWLKKKGEKKYGAKG